VNILRIAVALVLLHTVSILPAQQAPADLLIVDVHRSPYRASITYTLNISHQRFDMRNATILNLIDFARGQPDDDGREDTSIAGGPTWLDFDRYDIAALVPSLKAANSVGSQANPYAQLEPIVQRILAERFHLKSHSENRPLPGYIMTVSKDGAKLTPAKDPSAPNNCQTTQDKSAPPQILITCTSETVAQFLTTFSSTFRHPILDRTGLDKPYDFTLKFSSDQLQTRQDSINAYIDVITKQLGLIITPGAIPQPAIVVDAVERPTPNPPDIARLIPALPDLELEVASIRPAANDEPQSRIRPTGSQITFTSYVMQELLRFAWQLPTGAMLGNVPPWVSQARYTILVKLPPEVDARILSQDQDQLTNMLQKLLVDRFQIKYHWGEQIQDGWILSAGTPRMKKADPNSRTFCKHGPPEGGHDVRTADSPFDAEFHCQNVTMAQFADLAQSMAKSEVKNRVPNKTGLTGSYDFTLYYTTGHKMRLDAITAQALRQAGNPSSSDPIVGLSVEDAFRKQLGLKLEKHRGSYPALILDHIEQTPTEN